MKCDSCEKRKKSYAIIDTHKMREEEVCDKCVKKVFNKNGKVKIVLKKNSDSEMTNSSKGSYRFEVQEL